MEQKVRCRAAREVKKALRQEAHISTKVGNLRKAVVLWRKDLYTAPLLFTTVQSVSTNMYAHKKKTGHRDAQQDCGRVEDRASDKLSSLHPVLGATYVEARRRGGERHH
jgi:hypothetical protein